MVVPYFKHGFRWELPCKKNVKKIKISKICFHCLYLNCRRTSSNFWILTTWQIFGNITRHQVLTTKLTHWENVNNREKEWVSRFGACASDNVSAVKLILFGLIRSEYTTPAGYGGQVLQLAGIKIKLTGQCFGHVSERNKKAAHVKHIGIFAALHANVPWHSRNARTYELMRTYTVLF